MSPRILSRKSISFQTFTSQLYCIAFIEPGLRLNMHHYIILTQWAYRGRNRTTVMHLVCYFLVLLRPGSQTCLLSVSALVIPPPCVCDICGDKCQTSDSKKHFFLNGAVGFALQLLSPRRGGEVALSRATVVTVSHSDIFQVGRGNTKKKDCFGVSF